jgi:hypothetical protein
MYVLLSTYVRMYSCTYNFIHLDDFHVAVLQKSGKRKEGRHNFLLTFMHALKPFREYALISNGGKHSLSMENGREYLRHVQVRQSTGQTCLSLSSLNMVNVQIHFFPSLKVDYRRNCATRPSPLGIIDSIIFQILPAAQISHVPHNKTRREGN